MSSEGVIITLILALHRHTHHAARRVPTQGRAATGPSTATAAGIRPIRALCTGMETTPGDTKLLFQAVIIVLTRRGQSPGRQAHRPRRIARSRVISPVDGAECRTAPCGGTALDIQPHFTRALHTAKAGYTTGTPTLTRVLQTGRPSWRPRLGCQWARPVQR